MDYELLCSELSTFHRIFCTFFLRTVVLNNLIMNDLFWLLKILITYPSLQIPINSSGLIEYRAHPFWNQKYCPSHEHDNTARCCCCERLEVWASFGFLDSALTSSFLFSKLLLVIDKSLEHNWKVLNVTTMTFRVQDIHQ